MKSIKKSDSNHSFYGNEPKEKLESDGNQSISLTQYLRFIFIMILGYVLVTCGEEIIEPGLSPPDTDSVEKSFPDSLENFNEIREFDTGDLFDWQNSSSQSQWQYFFVSNSGGTSDYLNTTVLGGYPLSMSFSIPEITIDDYKENDLLKITWKMKVISIQSTGSYFPTVTAGLENENKVRQYGNWSTVEEVDGYWTAHTQYFLIDRTGSYQPFFICQRGSNINQLTIWWKDVRCYQVRETTAIP
jgi:hypothetical protein